MIRPKYFLPFTAVGFLVFIAAYLSINTNIPTIYSPMSLITAMPLIFWPFKYTPYFLMVGLYVAWSFALIYGQEKIPVRSKILSLILISLSLLYLIFGWKYSLNYQGMNYVICMYTFNLIFWCLLLMTYIRNRRESTFFTNLLFHGVLFIWLSWCAFPWMGELI